MERYEFLLGATTNNEIAFAEFVFYDDGRFSASFDTVTPFNVSTIDLHDYVESYLECFEKDALYDMCTEYACSPQDLPDYVENNYSIQDLIDCSLYPEIIEVYNNDWMFESSSCGQHDLKEDGMKLYTNKDFFEYLYQMWKEYHLSPMPEEERIKLACYIDDMKQVNEEEWIKEFIQNNF